MNMCEALRLGRRENKAIKLKDWPNYVYVYHGMDNVLHIIGDGSGDRELTLSVVLLLNFDWELSEEPYHGPLEVLSEETVDREEEAAAEEVTLTEVTSISQLPGYKLLGRGDEWERYAIDGEEYFYTSCGCAGIYDSNSRYVCRTEKELIDIILARRAKKSKPPVSEITSIAQLPGYKLLSKGNGYDRFKIGRTVYLDIRYGTAGIYSNGAHICQTEKEFIEHILAQPTKKRKPPISEIPPISEVTNILQLPCCEPWASGENYLRFRITWPKPAEYIYLNLEPEADSYVYQIGHYDQRCSQKEFIKRILAQQAEELKK